jgi:AcrR family transcriptional regulator
MPSITRRSTAAVGRPATAEAEILAATQRLLDGGATFTEIGVQQIRTEAGVARSTFYSHFRDKTELLLRLATELLGSSLDITSAWEPADGLDGLTEAFTEVVALYREQASVRRALAEVAAYDPAVRRFWADGIDRFTTRTLALLRAEQEAGLTPADVDLAGATRLIVLGGETALVEHVSTADPSGDAAFARELARTWWYGIYRRPESS